MAEDTVLLEWPVARDQARENTEVAPEAALIAINLAHQHLIFRPPLKGSNEGELQRSPQWLDFAPPVGFFPGLARSVSGLVWTFLCLDRTLMEGPRGVRRIGPGEHKRRNKSAISCKLRLAIRLVYFCSLSLGGQFF